MACAPASTRRTSTTTSRSCLSALHRAGRRVVIAGNQPPEARAALEAMELDVDAILISDELGAQKPSARVLRGRCRGRGRRAERDRLRRRSARQRRAAGAPRGDAHGPAAPWPVGPPARRAARCRVGRRRHGLARAPQLLDDLGWPEPAQRQVTAEFFDGAGDAQHDVLPPPRPDDLQPDRQAGVCGPIVLAARHGQRRARRDQVEDARSCRGSRSLGDRAAARGRRPPSPRAMAAGPSSGTAGHRGRRAHCAAGATATCARGSSRL